MELFTLHGNVISDGICSRLTIPRFKRGDDGFVFRHGLLQPPAQAQLHPSEGLQTALQAKALLFQKAIAGLTVQNGMEVGLASPGSGLQSCGCPRTQTLGLEGSSMWFSTSNLVALGTGVALSVVVATCADAQTPLSAEESDPTVMGWMQVTKPCYP